MLIMKNMSKKHVRRFFLEYIYIKRLIFLTVAPFDDYLLGFCLILFHLQVFSSFYIAFLLWTL